MHQAPRPFASMRSRRRRPVTAPRRPLEALESRVLFAAGDFDLTFGGGDGATLVNFAPGSADFAAALAVLPDGKMIVGGSVGDGSNTDDSFGLTKLNADGSLDLTFGGGDGMVTLDFGPGDADLDAIAIAPDGKIVAVGTTEAATTWDWAVRPLQRRRHARHDLRRRRRRWSPPTSSASATTPTASTSSRDGKIVVTGVDTAATSDIAVVRYNTDGSLDTTFDGDGKVFVNFFGGVDFASNIKVQPDNKLIIVGGSVRPGFYRRFVLVRLNPNGSLDSTFGDAGLATADFGASAFGKDVEQLANGQYVVGGWVDSQPTGDDQLDLAVARFNANGSLDGTFGSNGRTVVHGHRRPRVLLVRAGGPAERQGPARRHHQGPQLRDQLPELRRRGAGSTPTARSTRRSAPAGVRQFTIPGTPVGDSNVSDLELAARRRRSSSPAIRSCRTAGTDFAVVKLRNDDVPPPLPGAIAGSVYNDLNLNGVRDAGEAGLSDWTLFRDLNGNGVFDAGGRDGPFDRRAEDDQRPAARHHVHLDSSCQPGVERSPTST